MRFSPERDTARGFCEIALFTQEKGFVGAGFFSVWRAIMFSMVLADFRYVTGERLLRRIEDGTT